MPNKRFLIAANWKMHSPPPGFDAADSPYKTESAVDVAVFPSFIDLSRCISAQLITGGQTGRPEPSGALTGDVSIAQLKTVGCRYVLCGHSERRKNHGETDDYVAQQAIAALEAGLHPIVCVGETADERKKGKQHDVVKKQLKDIPSGIIVAYEPVWAISGGDPSKPAASAQDAQDMHAFIRSLLPDKAMRILYGGSMNGKNCEELLKCPDIDGGLVGGASLKPEEFKKIVEVAVALEKNYES
ncbi:MAG: triose-phosphate isomerase [Candidatus Peribacteraceae bacterium]|nr:triose-phosphate isomerase [Candidatus Peribacteraceae bacterium]